MTIGFVDRTVTKLTGSVTATDTLLLCWGGDIAQFRPGDQDVFVVLRDAQHREVARVVGIQPFTGLIVERGQDGSTPRAFASGSIVSARMVKGALASRQQKGVLRQVAYNPNAVLMPAYFGEKVAETGVEGCVRRVWQNVLPNKMSWRIVYGDMCQDLTNWRDWDWEIHDFPWQWWPWSPPVFKETPDAWLDASLYDFEDGVQVSYPAGAPLGEDCSVFPTNPVYELISENVFRSSLESDIGHPVYFSSGKYGGNGAIKLVVEGNKQPFFGLYCNEQGLQLPSPTKTCIVVTSLDFSGGNDFEASFGTFDANHDYGIGLQLSREGTNLKVVAGVRANQYVAAAEVSIGGDDNLRVFAFRFNISEAGNFKLFINGEQPEYTLSIESPEDVAYTFPDSYIDFSMWNTYIGPTSPPGYTGTAHLCEFQVFDRWLTDEQIAAQTELLKKKWGIA